MHHANAPDAPDLPNAASVEEALRALYVTRPDSSLRPEEIKKMCE